MNALIVCGRQGHSEACEDHWGEDAVYYSYSYRTYGVLRTSLRTYPFVVLLVVRSMWLKVAAQHCLPIILSHAPRGAHPFFKLTLKVGQESDCMTFI